MRTFRHLVSWVIALALIFLFLQATIHPLPNPPEGSVKFFDLPGENIVFQTLAMKSGYAIFEPTGRVVTGFLELVAAFFLLLPFTRRLGAVLSSLILGGAVAMHMSPWLGREVPVSLTDVDAGGDGGILFTLAVIMLVCSLLLLVVHPGRDLRS
jgi:uncharacterized membrane protein YphA (DoxX/SURF4 family)